MSILDQFQCTVANQIRKLYVSTVVFFGVAVLHLFWGITLLFGPPLHTTALEVIADGFYSFRIAGFSLIIASLCGFYVTKNSRSISAFIFLIPQQILLVFSTIGA